MTVDTQKLRELLEKATPGPWDVRYDYVVQATSFDNGRLVPVAQPYGVNGDGSDLFANSRLIAAARNTLPALLDEIDTLRNHNTLLKAALANVENENDRLRAELEAMQWRGIETAPKSVDTPILVLDCLHSQPWHYECIWNGFEWYHGFGESWPKPNPTHWMPLPPAPPQGEKD